jgi:hypothetical protein
VSAVLLGIQQAAMKSLDEMLAAEAIESQNVDNG